MANTSRFNGFKFDPDNNRLDFYYQGTRIGNLDASGFDLATAAVLASGVTVSGGSVTVSSTAAHSFDATDLTFPNMPTSDPASSNQVYDNTNVVTLSA